MDGGSSPAGEISAGGAGLELSLRVLFSRVLLQTFVFPPGAVCAVCVLSSDPAPALPQGGKGKKKFLLPWNICLCWFVLARVRCCWQEKGGCQSAQEKTSAAGKVWAAWWSGQISNFCVLGHGGHSWKRQWHILNPIGKGWGRRRAMGSSSLLLILTIWEFPEAVKPQRVLGCSSTGKKELDICQFL